MLNQIQAVYRAIKTAKARSDALVEEGRQMTGWYRSAKKRQNKVPQSLLHQLAAIQVGDR